MEDEILSVTIPLNDMADNTAGPKNNMNIINLFKFQFTNASDPPIDYKKKCGFLMPKNIEIDFWCAWQFLRLFQGFFIIFTFLLWHNGIIDTFYLVFYMIFIIISGLLGFFDTKLIKTLSPIADSLASVLNSGIIHLLFKFAEFFNLSRITYFIFYFRNLSFSLILQLTFVFSKSLFYSDYFENLDKKHKKIISQIFNCLISTSFIPNLVFLIIYEDTLYENVLVIVFLFIFICNLYFLIRSYEERLINFVHFVFRFIMLFFTPFILIILMHNTFYSDTNLITTLNETD